MVDILGSFTLKKDIKEKMPINWSTERKTVKFL